MQKGNRERQVITMYGTKVPDKQDIIEKTLVVTTHTVTLPPNHISMVPLTLIHYTGNIQSNTLL